MDFLEDSNFYSDDIYDLTSLADSTDIPDWAAISMQWIDRGIVVEALMPNTEGYATGLQSLDNPAEMVSEETIGLLAATFDPDLDNWRDQLEEYGSDDEDLSYFVEELYGEMYLEVERQSDRPPRKRESPNMADVLDLSLVLAESYSGVDLERDLMDYLGGKLILGVEELDLARIQERPADETVNVVAMVSYIQEEEDSFADTLEDLTDLLEDEINVDIDSEDVGAENDARIIEPGFPGIETEYAPGYVLHDGFLILGTTEEALENAVGAQTSDQTDLASLGEYQRAVATLPGDKQFLFWMSLQHIVSQLDPDDFDMTEDEFEAMEVSVGSIAASANADAEQIRTSLSIT